MFNTPGISSDHSVAETIRHRNPGSTRQTRHSTIAFADGRTVPVKKEHLHFIRQNNASPAVVLGGKALLLKSNAAQRFDTDGRTLSAGDEVSIRVLDSGADLLMPAAGTSRGRPASNAYTLNTSLFMRTFHAGHTGSFRNLVEQYTGKIHEGEGSTRAPSSWTAANDGRTPLFDRTDDIPLSIALESDGSAVLIEDLKLEKLVLSGGGAKGVVYPGVFKALEETGQMQHIGVIEGSSIGASEGALLASGMTAAECKTCVNDLDFSVLFKKNRVPHSVLFSAPSSPSKAKAQFSILTNLGTTAPNMKYLIDHHTRKAALKTIAAAGGGGDEIRHIVKKLEAQDMLDTLRAQKEQGMKVDAGQLNKLEKWVQRKEAAQRDLAELKTLENKVLLSGEHALSDKEKARLRILTDARSDLTADVGRIGNLTFRDLHALSQHIPGIKQFRCTGTALYSGEDVEGQVPQLVVFSDENEDTRDTEISLAACISSALPSIFKKFKHDMSHDLADGSAKTRFIDGGLMMNTPAHELIDPDAGESENLIVSLEHPLMTEVLTGKYPGRRSLKDRLIDKIIVKLDKNFRIFRGNFKHVARQLGDDKFAKQAIEARLKGAAGKTDYSGSKGTLALGMTKTEKHALQEAAYQIAIQHIENRHSETRYKNLDQLLLNLPDQRFDELVNAWDAGMSPALAGALKRVAVLRPLLHAAHDSIRTFTETIQGWHESRSKSDMETDIRAWMHSMSERIGDNRDLQEVIANAVVRSRTPSMQRVLDILRDTPVEHDAGAHFPQLCRQKDEANVCRKISLKIIRDFIYPVRERPGQLDANIRLLDRAEQRLSQASTRKQVNIELHRIERKYQVLGTSELNGLTPVLPKLRTYYLGGHMSIERCNALAGSLAMEISNRIEDLSAKSPAAVGLEGILLSNRMLMSPAVAVKSPIEAENPIRNSIVQGHKRAMSTDLKQDISGLNELLKHIPAGQLTHTSLTHCLAILAPHNLNDKAVLLLRKKLNQLATPDQQAHIQTRLEAVRLEAKERNLLVTYALPDGQKIEFPPPPGWPIFNTGSKKYHRYSSTTPTISGIKFEDLQNAMESVPTPGAPSPATLYGTLNNVTPEGLKSFLKSPVISYVMENGTVVNVTQPEHPLWPGFVARSIVQTEAGWAVQTYGEGMGWMQSPFSPASAQPVVNRVWNSVTEDMIKRRNNS